MPANKPNQKTEKPATDKGKTVLVWDPVGEFQAELLERHLYWKSLGQTEYAAWYLAGLHNITKQP